MIHLSFFLPEPDSPWRETWDRPKHGNPGSIQEIDLRYKYFAVNVEMTINDVEVISRRRFVTLADLALSLSHTVGRVSSGEDAAFGFTESDEVIHLRRDGSIIHISSSKRPWQVSADPEELISAFVTFLREAHSCLITEIPELASNPTVQRLSPR
ncbi:hypothetical protein [Streptomyces rimosus]|uniref:hypothetical protein n=1 Tax=Streptomyces rimosus TaxID=1927 RepID=UPI0037981DEF